MPLTLNFASKSNKKTKNCSKGYPCGSACINKGRNCKKKLSDQASNYADWLKLSAKAKPNNSWSDRRAKLSKYSKDKAVDLIVKHTVDGQMDGELRTSVAELLDESTKKVIRNVGDRVVGTVERAGMSPTMKRKRDGKTVINPEWRNLTDDLAREVLANQNKFVKGSRNSAGELTRENNKGDRKADKVDKFVEDIIDSNDAGVSKPQLSKEAYAQLRSRKEELGINSKDVADKIREKVLSTIPDYQTLGRDGKITYDDTARYLLDPDLARSKQALQEQVDYMLSPQRIVKAGRRDIDVINGYRALIKDYDNIANPRQKKTGRSEEKPGFIKKRGRRKSRNYSEPSISKGDTVTWKWGTGSANGKVLAIYYRSVSRKLKGSEITRNGTRDNPAYLIGQNDGSKILKLKSELI